MGVFSRLFQSKRGMLRRIDSTKRWIARHKMASTTIAGLIIIGFVGWGVVQYISRSQESAPANTEVVQYYEDKLPELSSSVDNRPNDLTARRDYATALYVTGDVKKAKEQYEMAIKLDSDDATLHNNLGNTYRDLKEYDKAKSSYETAIRLNAQHQNAYINLANLQMNIFSESDDAIATYERAITAIPEDTQLKLLLGLAYEQSGNTQLAIQTFENILEQQPDYTAARSNLERLGAKEN